MERQPPSSSSDPVQLRLADGLDGPGAGRALKPLAEPAAVLRAKLLAITYQCPNGSYVAECPFQKFMGVGHQSRSELLARMNYDELLRLFDLASPCACPVDPRRDRGPAPVTPAP